MRNMGTNLTKIALTIFLTWLIISIITGTNNSDNTSDHEILTVNYKLEIQALEELRESRFRSGIYLHQTNGLCEGPEEPTLTSSSPISILGNAELVNKTTSGSGTSGDPYIIENLKIESSVTTGLLRISNTSDFFIIRNNVFDSTNLQAGANRRGIILDNTTNGLVTNNIIRDSNVALLIGNTGYNNNITTNEFFTVGTGVSVQQQGNDTLVSDNNFCQATVAVIVQDSFQITVSDNIVTDSRNFGMRVLHSNQISITENEIRNTSNAGIRVETSMNVEISFNNITYSTKNAITLIATQGYRISDNTIYHNRKGIGLSNSSGAINDPALVSRNEIYENFVNGIQLDGSSKVIIQDNEIYLNQGSGISLLSSTGIEIIENRIYRNQRNGIQIASGSGATVITNNFVAGQFQYAVTADFDTIGVEALANDFIANARELVDKRQLYFDNSNNTVSGNYYDRSDISEGSLSLSIDGVTAVGDGQIVDHNQAANEITNQLPKKAIIAAPNILLPNTDLFDNDKSLQLQWQPAYLIPFSPNQQIKYNVTIVNAKNNEENFTLTIATTDTSFKVSAEDLKKKFQYRVSYNLVVIAYDESNSTYGSEIDISIPFSILNVANFEVASDLRDLVFLILPVVFMVAAIGKIVSWRRNERTSFGVSETGIAILVLIGIIGVGILYWSSRTLASSEEEEIALEMDLILLFAGTFIGIIIGHQPSEKPMKPPGGS